MKTKEEKNDFLSRLDGRNPDRWVFSYLHENGWDESAYYTSLEQAQDDWKNRYNGPDYTTEIRKESFSLPYCTKYDYIIPLIQKQPRSILTQIVLSMKGQNDVSRMVDWLMFSPEELANILIKVTKNEKTN